MVSSVITFYGLQPTAMCGRPISFRNIRIGTISENHVPIPNANPPTMLAATHFRGFGEDGKSSGTGG